MCIKCGCYGAINPYGVGGRAVNAAPTEANIAQYNNIKPVIMGEGCGNGDCKGSCQYCK
jgi:hypothetical protein